MNRLTKAGCRVFQKGMRAALPVLPYRKPEVLHHMGDVPRKLEELGCASVLLVTDASIRALGITAPLEEALSARGIACAVFETVPNPTTDVAERAVELYRERACTALIGFGGGSSMDTAKAVGARIANPRKSYAQMGGILRVRRRIPPLFAIPTTAGTGSEVTVAAVVIDSETRHKYAIMDFPLIPRYAVLDPETTRTLPPHVTATTGMDALCHAVEAYIGNSTTAETRKEARSAVKLAFLYLEDAFRDGDDMIARKQMLLASFLAGDAFSKSYVGYVHAVAHSIGGTYDLPHGLVIAVVLPHVLEAYGQVIWPKLHELACAAGLAGTHDPDEEAARRFIDAIREKNRTMGIPDALPEVREEDIPAMARQAAAEANPLYPVPVIWDARELERFYRAVMAPDGADSGNGQAVMTPNGDEETASETAVEDEKPQVATVEDEDLLEAANGAATGDEEAPR